MICEESAAMHRLFDEVDRLKIEVERLTLRWTTSPPTVPGDYYFRPEPGVPKRIHEVYMLTNPSELYAQSASPFKNGLVSKMTGEWAGPIPEPMEAQS